MLEKGGHFLLRWTEIISLVFFWILLASVFLSVCDRFILHIGFFWTEELARFLFIWLGFLAAAIMVQRRGHFAVPFLVDKLLGKEQKEALDIFFSGIIVLLMTLLLIYGIMYAEFGRLQPSPALGIGMCYVYYSVPVGAALMIFFGILHIYKDVKSLTRAKKRGLGTEVE